MVKEHFEALDSVSLNLGGGAGIVMSIVLCLIMFGIALGISKETLKNVFLQPKSLITGLTLQWIGLPLVTFLLIILIHRWITPMVALGMILVASCPGGNVSNFISSLSKGNTELSIGMTAVATIFAPVVTPFNFWAWGNAYLRFARLSDVMVLPHIQIPFGEVFETVFIILGIPIVLGMLFANYLPGITAKIRKPFSVFSIIVFIAMVLGMFIPNWQIFLEYIFVIFVLVLIHNACAFGTGYLGATLMKLPMTDRKSITIEVGIQNSGLGLTMLLNPAIFDPQIWSNEQSGVMYGGMLFVTAWWAIWHIISGLGLASLFRRCQ